MCTKFCENPTIQTWVIEYTRFEHAVFWDPHHTKKIRENSKKYLRPPKSNQLFIMVQSTCVPNLVKIRPYKLELSCTQENFTFLTFVNLTFDLGSQNMVEDTSFLTPFHVVKLQPPTPTGKAQKGRDIHTDVRMDTNASCKTRLLLGRRLIILDDLLNQW